MKRSTTLLLATAALMVSAGSALAGDVTVTINGVQARGGELLAALQTQAQFMKHEGAYGELIANPGAGTRTVTFHDVAPGDYSFSALHDVNGDRLMATENNRPAEGWAMLHGETLRAVPTFDQVKFTVPVTGNVSLTVSMDYPR